MATEKIIQPQENCFLEALLSFLLACGLAAIPLLIVLSGGKEMAFIVMFTGMLLFYPAMGIPFFVGFVAFARSKNCAALGAFAVYPLAFFAFVGAGELSNVNAVESYTELMEAHAEIEKSPDLFHAGDRVILRSGSFLCHKLCEQMLVFTKADSVVVEDWGQGAFSGETWSLRNGKVEQSAIYRLDDIENCTKRGKKLHRWSLSQTTVEKFGLSRKCIRRKIIKPISASDSDWIIAVDSQYRSNKNTNNVRIVGRVKLLRMRNGVDQILSFHQFGFVRIVESNFNFWRTERGTKFFGYPRPNHKLPFYNSFATMVGLPLQ